MRQDFFNQDFLRLLKDKVEDQAKTNVKAKYGLPLNQIRKHMSRLDYADMLEGEIHKVLVKVVDKL